MTELRRDIDRRISERYLAALSEQDVFTGYSMYRLNLKMIRQMLTATEEAMDAEGIPADVRDRIIYRLLYGEAPTALEVPDRQDVCQRSSNGQ